MPPRQAQQKMLPVKLAALLQALKEGEYNCEELAQIADLHYVTVLTYCRALHDAEPKLIHICKYEKDVLGRSSIAIYKWGSEPDVQRPRLSRAEQQRNYRKRVRLRQAVVTENAIAALAPSPRRRVRTPGPPSVPRLPDETQEEYLRRVQFAPPQLPLLEPEPTEAQAEAPTVVETEVEVAIPRRYFFNRS